MAPETTFHREQAGELAVYHVKGAFDRAGAWVLRDRIDRDPAPELLLDFSVVRDFSDLAVAVLAHGLTFGSRPVRFRGLRERQLRILSYCGVPLQERGGGTQRVTPGGQDRSAGWQPESPEAQ